MRWPHGGHAGRRAGAGGGLRRLLADEGAEQYGFCSPGFIMDVLAMERELHEPTEDEIKAYLAGNLCRCSGYQGQLRAIQKYLAAKGERV